MSTGLTLKQERLVEAVLDPSTESVSEAGRLAGYKHAQSTHRALKAAETQRELERRKGERLDLVQAHAHLVQRSLSTLARDKDWNGAKSVQFLMAAKGADFASLQEQATPEAATQTHRDRAQLMLLDAMERGMRIAHRWPHRIPHILAAIERRRRTE